MNASFQEKSVWIQLVSMVAVLGSYFVIAGVMLSNGVTVIVAYVPLFIVATVLLVVVLVAGHIAVAAASVAAGNKPEGPDERDRLIGWRAESNSAWILAVGVCAAITGLVASVESVYVAHLLVLSMLLSEVAKYVLQLVYYRRGL